MICVGVSLVVGNDMCGRVISNWQYVWASLWLIITVGHWPKSVHVQWRASRLVTWSTYLTKWPPGRELVTVSLTLLEMKRKCQISVIAFENWQGQNFRC